MSINNPKPRAADEDVSAFISAAKKYIEANTAAIECNKRVIAKSREDLAQTTARIQQLTQEAWKSKS